MTSKVANRAFYTAIGVTVEGKRDVLGIWGSAGAEGAKYWLSVLTELKNQPITNTFFVVCDGLKGLPEAVEVVWPKATFHTCILHLIPNTFRYASKKDWDGLKRDIKPIYTAPSATAAEPAREAMSKKCWQVSRDRALMGKRVGRSHRLPRLRHRDTHRVAFNQRDRVAQR